MPRRQLDFREFDSIIKDIETLRQQGYTKVGKWDLSQVCRHLSIAMQMSIRDQKVQSAPWLVRKLVAPIIRRRIFKTRKMPEGIKVPDSILPGAPVDEAAAVSKFFIDMKELRDHKGDFVPHPFFGRLSPGDWQQLHLIHSAHHLSFLIPN